MLQLPRSRVHLYANDLIVSYLYDRRECRPAGGPADFRCEVFLAEFVDNDKRLWVIERKNGRVDYDKASHTSEQIDACIEVLDAPRGWHIRKCVIAESFSADGVQFLFHNDITHLDFDLNRHSQQERNIITAVRHLRDH